VETGNRVSASAEEVLEALRAVEDPEAAMSIVDLGLVYDVQCAEQQVKVDMTLTSPSCPLGPYMVDEVIAAVRAAVPGMPDVQVNLVWDPPWTPERMSEAARARFGWSP
jgi:metal-sulfur cluster biosynthetic enzyme